MNLYKIGARIMIATPTVTQQSAKLNVGQRDMIKSGKSQSIKSTTFPSRILSAKFPKAPDIIIAIPVRTKKSPDLAER